MNGRRQALIKIGKYAVYTPPAMVVTLGAARGAAVSRTPRRPLINIHLQGL